MKICDIINQYYPKFFDGLENYTLFFCNQKEKIYIQDDNTRYLLGEFNNLEIHFVGTRKFNLTPLKDKWVNLGNTQLSNVGVESYNENELFLVGETPTGNVLIKFPYNN